MAENELIISQKNISFNVNKMFIHVVELADIIAEIICTAVVALHPKNPYHHSFQTFCISHKWFKCVHLLFCVQWRSHCDYNFLQTLYCKACLKLQRESKSYIISKNFWFIEKVSDEVFTFFRLFFWQSAANIAPWISNFWSLGWFLKNSTKSISGKGWRASLPVNSTFIKRCFTSLACSRIVVSASQHHCTPRTDKASRDERFRNCTM